MVYLANKDEKPCDPRKYYKWKLLIK